MAEQRYSAFNEPFFLQWHLTDRCNLNCRHCYRDTPKPDLHIDALNVILSNYVNFLKEMGRKGRIQFSGGEPWLSPYLYELTKAARRHHMPVRILSNGTLVTEESAKTLHESGCPLVQVSLEGLEATHDAIRGAGTFQQALAGIAALRKAGLEVTISLTLSRLNIAEALDVATLAETVADRVHFSRLVPVGSGKALADAALSPQEIHQLMKALLKFRKGASIDLPLRDPLWKAYFNPHLRRCHAVSGCAVGYNGLTIDSNGDVYPCRRLPIVIGNACHQSLQEIWQAPLLQALRDRDQLKGKCGQCRLRWVCGGCRGIAYATTGDPLSEDPQCFRPLALWEKLASLTNAAARHQSQNR